MRRASREQSPVADDLDQGRDVSERIWQSVWAVRDSQRSATGARRAGPATGHGKFAASLVAQVYFTEIVNLLHRVGQVGR